MKGKSRWDLEKKIALRAIKDPEFLKELKKHPKQTISKMLAQEGFPSSVMNGFDIKIYEEKANEIIIPIPHIPTLSEKALEEEDLKAIAGGCGQPGDYSYMTSTC